MNIEDETSVSRMRTLRFNDKMTILNNDFLKFLRSWYEQCPHYDFTDTVQSYIKHVEKLEVTYSLKNEVQVPNQKKAESSKPIEISVSTPAGVPPRLSVGNVSAIVQNDSPSTVSTPGGRKRVIRGGGPSGGTESVHFRGVDPATNKLNVPPVTITLPKPSPGFWDKHKDQAHEGTMPTFNLVKPTQEILLPVHKTNDSPKLGFSFRKDSNEASSASIENISKPTFKFGSSVPKANSDKETNEEKNNSFNVEEPKSALTFGTTAPKLVTSSGPLTLTFGSSIPKASEEDGDDEGEYVPPKAEPEKVEPGATYSVKCAMFQMVGKKFEKKGVGMLHLKEEDSKKSVLVRAATSIGTVWINSLINSSMKVAKAGDEKGEKLRITLPISSTEIGVYLIRFPNEASADQVLKHIEANNK